MKPFVPVNKLLRIALLTSTAIGLVTVGPAYIVGITLANVTTSPALLLKLVAVSVTGITLFIFLFWLINIGLLNFMEGKIKAFGNHIPRYVSSYLAGFLLMFSIRAAAMSVFNDPLEQQQVFDWKIRAFGLDPGTINYLPYTRIAFQFLIIVFVVISINTVVLVIQELVLLNEKKKRIEAENTLLQIRNVEAANLQLKQQLKPHFLFNSLNVLKTLIKKQPGNAEVYLKRLSDFLRVSVSSGDVNLVKLEDELKLSMDYLEMQKIRFGDAIHFDVNIPYVKNTGLVPVFSIQLLIENAIKHNAFTPEEPLNININGDYDRITVTNNIRHKISEESFSGTGLANLSERYRLLSGEEIDIRTDNSTFSVSIKILSNENRHH
ncbi:MAG TPA: histidine kinase [Bacteroidales bacterium]|nr:histidine kinase [Bacteroidales bacterium]